MKLTVLGCDGSFPGAHGACSSYLVESDDGRLLLDLGCGALPQLMARCRPEELDAVVITHWHNDHASDMLALQYYLLIKKLRMKVLAPKQTHPLKELLGQEEFDFKDLGIPRSIAGFDLSAHPVRHPLPAYAVKLSRNGKTLVYTGDTAGGEGLAAFCFGADLLICDACFTTAQWREGLPHFTAAQAGQLAKDAGVQKLMITHAQPGSDKAALLREARAFFPNTIQAEQGLSLSL